MNNKTKKLVHDMAVRKRIIYTPPRGRVGRVIRGNWHAKPSSCFQNELSAKRAIRYSSTGTCDGFRFSTEPMEKLPIPGLLRRC